LRPVQRRQCRKPGGPVLRFHRADHQILPSKLGRVIGDIEPDPPAAVPFLDTQSVMPDRRHGFATGHELWDKPGAGQRERYRAADGAGADDRDR